MKIVSLLLLTMLLYGCSAVSIVSSSASYAVSKYCEVPQSGRQAIRKAVAKSISPNSIVINCEVSGE